MKYVLACILSMSIVGCATVSYNYVPQTALQGSPPVGETRTVAIGDPLLTQGVMTMYDIIKVAQPTKVSIIIVEPGNYRKVGTDGRFEFYETYDGPKSGKFGGSSGEFRTIAIRIDTVTGDTCFIGNNTYEMCSNPAVKMPFTRATEAVLSPIELQQTLLYNGKVGNKLNIGYREFKGDLARPAFSNEVEYDLSESRVIGYKGASLEVLDATNRSITYKVISNFR